jgi:Tfp pilus assembly protein PilP
MKLTTGILVLGMAAGNAWGQNPDVIENTRNTLKAVEQKKAMDSNAALAASQGQPAKPAAPVSGKKAAEAPAKPASSHPKTTSVAAAAVPTKSTSATAVGSKTKPSTATLATNAPKKAGKSVAPKTKAKAATKPARPKQKVAVKDKKSPEVAKKQEPKVINITGRRDPFVSPVVNRSMIGSGCSMGKRCLAIDQISLKGVVKAEAGMIAVVVNAMDKAYFLRENDPVFNGYVVKITGDSIIFKETLQDRLGKSFTREVTKKINTPAV